MLPGAAGRQCGDGMRLALIGCGSIGSKVASEIARGALPEVRLIGLADPISPQAASRVAQASGVSVCPDVASLLGLGADIVLEAASADAVRAYAHPVLDSGADMLVVSVGAFVDTEFFASLLEHAREKGRRLLIPSGAIGGLDILKAAAMAGLEECRLTTTKPPSALHTTYTREHGIDLRGIQQPTVIFEGTAAQAVRHFPQNLNVAVSISLAGLGLERTTVRVIADPGATCNSHEVFARGTFGEATIRLQNIPSRENPRSSALASYSVIATLDSISRPCHLGT